MQFIRLSFALFILLLAWADADNCWYDFSSDSRALTYSCQNFDDGGVFYTSSLKQSDCLRNEDGELLFQNGSFFFCHPMSNDQAIDVEYEAEELPAQTASSKLVQVKILME
ncbi:uncharacterized protein N7479_002415 [Penicillium vulpinum]|uniref:uncharacterized protein n=1 Tax=Penicillium vulpinum TaxID=29845 RepID=UPI002549A1FF|nr:uncharacterized protein N7479_002415 [Penicillium vulpinum]KAJ5972497.1 hypothetical protein N7479_002415 [Penicillium vulpinum]